MGRFFARVLIGSVCSLAMPAIAAAAGWNVEHVEGSARVEQAGATIVALAPAMMISGDAWVETGADGRATIARNGDRIVIAPNTRLHLAADDSNGLTGVLEQFGKLFFQVSKQAHPHLRVDTPFLAAVVKGTTFDVIVDDVGARVKVSEGLVLVSSLASADQTLVGAGSTASVSAQAPADLRLDQRIVPPSLLRREGANEAIETWSGAAALPSFSSGTARAVQAGFVDAGGQTPEAATAHGDAQGGPGGSLPVKAANSDIRASTNGNASVQVASAVPLQPHNSPFRASGPDLSPAHFMNENGAQAITSLITAPPQASSVGPNAVLEATLSGLGLGILASALAIAFVGARKRRLGRRPYRPTGAAPQ